MVESFEDLIKKGQQAMESGDTLMALVKFETASNLKPLPPEAKARLGYCLASERRQFKKGAALCSEALRAQPSHPDPYYQLGRIYLLAGQKPNAIATFRRGLKQRRYQPLIDQLHQLGLRKEPVFSSLPREHFLNRHLGRLMAMLGAR